MEEIPWGTSFQNGGARASGAEQLILDKSIKESQEKFQTESWEESFEEIPGGIFDGIILKTSGKQNIEEEYWEKIPKGKLGRINDGITE